MTRDSAALAKTVIAVSAPRPAAAATMNAPDAAIYNLLYYLYTYLGFATYTFG